MIAYSIRILPLITNLKREIPCITHPWYADNAGSLSTFAIIETYFDFLACQGPGRGYQSKPTKSILIVCPENLDARKLFGACHGFRVCMSARYLGAYIGDDKSKHDWLGEPMMTWEKNINTISKTAGKHPHESYTAVVRTIQLE